MKKNEQGQVAAGILISIVALLLVVGVIVGGYQLNWWLRGQEVNRSAKINRTSYEVQQTNREVVLKDMQKVATDDRQIADPSYKGIVAQLRAERIHDVTVACGHISRLTTSGAGVDPDIQLFHDKECITP